MNGLAFKSKDFHLTAKKWEYEFKDENQHWRPCFDEIASFLGGLKLEFLKVSHRITGGKALGPPKAGSKARDIFVHTNTATFTVKRWPRKPNGLQKQLWKLVSLNLILGGGRTSLPWELMASDLSSYEFEVWVYPIFKV